MAEALLTRIQKQIDERRRELELAIAEYESLELAARALQSAAGGAATRPVRAARSARSRTGTHASGARTARTGAAGRTSAASATSSARAPRRPARGTRKRAPRGANRDAMLRALRSSGQGAIASQLAKRAGVGRVSSYQVLTGLEREGLVRRREQASGPALYSLA